MKNFDNNMEMFDAYLNNEMSGDDRKEFETLLNNDKELKQEFKDYKELLFALQSTCNEADKEFEQAMRGISDEDMKNIVSSKKEQRTQTQVQDEETHKGKMVPLRTVYRWVSAAAAILLIVGVGSHLFLGRQAANNMCDAIAMSHDFKTIKNTSRGGDGDNITPEEQQQNNEYNQAIELLENDKTDEAIKILENLYGSSKFDNVKSQSSISLAYAYVKTHDIDNAKRIIGEVKKDKGDYTPSELLNLEKALDKK